MNIKSDQNYHHRLTEYAKNVKTVRSKVLILTWKVRGVSKWVNL